MRLNTREWETKEIIWFLASLYFWNPLRYGFLGIPGYLGGKPIADPEVKKKKLHLGKGVEKGNA